MFKLVISDDEGKTTVVPLVRDEITIGRKEGNTIRLTERNVSRRHARLRRNDGAFNIADLGSYNGVRINGQRIEHEKEVALNAGDQVAIGDYVLALQAEGDTETVSGMPQPAAPARLVMLTPPTPGAEFGLTRHGMRIGRAEDLDMWINHRSISREHAEVSIDDGVIRVRDLESANGMRLNGEEVDQVELSSGDVLELGQVRFRFVGEGEMYVFEADRTVAMDALPEYEEEESQRSPWMFFSALIIAVAIAVGAAIALSGGDEETPEPVGNGEIPTPTTEEPTTEPGVTSEVDVAMLRQNCERLVENESFSDASEVAARCLAESPGDSACAACRDAAAAGLSNQALIERVELELRNGRYEEAYQALSAIPADSPIANHPVRLRAAEAYADSLLGNADEEMRAGNREAGNSLIEQAMAVSPLSSEAAERRAATARSLRETPTEALRANPPARRPNMRRPPAQTNVSPMTSEPTPTPTEMAAPSGPQWRVVYDRCSGDQACIARNLRPRSARGYGILIEAYRALGRNAQKNAAIRNLLRQFPDSREARRYGRQL